MEVQDVRERISKYVKDNGIKYAYIASKIGVHRSTLCHFLKDDRFISEKVCTNLANC